MARSKSSARWLREHFSDDYVKRAQQEGYRSRAVFKLKEIQDRDKLLKPGMTVVDLGAAPGGWSQFARNAVGSSGLVIALDLLKMDGIDGVVCLQGDFSEPEVVDSVLGLLADRKADLVISDMAPNTSGIKAVDQPRAIYLAELAADFAGLSLKPGGALLLKAFQGEGFDGLLKQLRARFASVMVRKPKASRPRSTELYLLARNYRL